jgi:hypothetical protein
MDKLQPIKDKKSHKTSYLSQNNDPNSETARLHHTKKGYDEQNDC